ncbi:right-handed parallel beta-helix repeat-containing protein [Halostella sp. JP-L12]|uniref:right-handed parallel beta-helix repeat-containing protein n=1 Tax=Halostella TaxID=1843185 RepID=UPI000EF7F6ED|nr:MULTISPECIES: right-handed parallel beta-helix repeat-containing protein [Halostella]NHN46284.1 right-handed parallel beta-helix repeat-containing protein [Halostella sp. JP-L12]
MTYDKLRSGVALVMTLVLVVSVVPAGAIAQDDGQEGDGATTIDSCTTITEPGTYELAGDLTNATANATILEFDGTRVTACVVVAADDVVLNGGGNAVEGSTGDPVDTGVSIGSATADANVTNASGDANQTAATGQNETFSPDVGVAVLPLHDARANLTNVTVRNVSSTGWFGGVFASNVTGSTIAGVDASGNAESGLILENVTDTSVSDVRADDNAVFGVIAFSADDNALSSVRAADNGFVGYFVAESHRTQFRNVTATNQSLAGMAFFNATENVVSGLEVRNTAGDDPMLGPSAGLLFENASDNFLTGVAASDNRNWTYHAANGSTDNVVLNLTADDRQLSFVATDVAVRFDRNATGGVGTPFVAVDTGENASILVDVNWSSTGAPTGAAENETLEAGDNLTDAEAANATGDGAVEPANATAGNETAT